MVIELTTKAEGRMSGPVCSVVVVFWTRATGFQPMGQNGLRPWAWRALRARLRREVREARVR
jgi:hypothetical protein